MFSLSDKEANRIIRDIRNKKSSFWEKKREEGAVSLFQKAARGIPAYKDFLKRNGVNPQKIKTFADFEQIPLTDKKDYLKQYPLKSLAWGNCFKNEQLAFCSTSGSTGEPFYFPRSHELEWESSILHQIFLENSVEHLKQPTLVIIGFGMGVWIGGVLTYKAIEIASLRGKYPISVIAPGINKIEIFNALKKLAPNYKQTILVGYAPFIKDVLDEASSQGINLKKLNIRMLFAAEAFPENFRDYLCAKVGIKNPCLDTLNVYGTADIGTMAYETPISILIRRLAVKNKKLFREIFSSIDKTPTLAQYNPDFITFESLNGEIILTGDNSIPLIRYSVGDHGGTYSFGELSSKLKKFGLNIYKEAEKAGIRDYVYELPFVYVYERINLATNLYGLIVYPETIREALLDKTINSFITSKFTMLTKFDSRQNQRLEINIELKKDKKVDKVAKEKILKKIVSHLRYRSSEFRELSDYLKERVFPKLVFWPAGHPLYFTPGIKQKWVKN